MSDFNLKAGLRRLARQEFELVYAQSIDALKRNDQNPIAFFLIGEIAARRGHVEKSVELFSKAAELNPKEIHYQLYSAKALLALGRISASKEKADIAAKLGTKDALLADLLGNIYSRAGHHDAAIPWFEKAVRANPRWPKFHFNLGASAQFAGDFKTAKAAYEKGLKLDPKFYRAWYSLTKLEKQTGDNHHLAKLLPLFESAGRDADARLLIGHAIAKTYEDLEEYETSFEWFEKAKLLKKDQIHYDAAKAAKAFHAARTSIDLTTDENEDANGCSPIFIMGLPRTGTTLLDRILSSHSEVNSAGETHLFAQLIAKAVGASAKAAFDAQAVSAAKQIDLAAVGCAYLTNTQDVAGQGSHFIDKTPLNFFYADLILKALPKAKIIVLRRGAMDSCLSNYRELFDPHTSPYPYTYDLSNIAAYYCEFDALIAHWKTALPADRFTEIYYEDLVQDQENQTRRLLALCGLPWEEQCLNFHENKSAVDSASSVQVRQPLYAGSIGRWKKYGDKLEGLEAALGPLARN